jgi:DNA-binding NarL/FixJ family response regulator
MSEKNAMLLIKRINPPHLLTPVTLSQLHIMIFDDDAASRTELRRALQYAGGTYITEASNLNGVVRGGVSFPSSLDVIISDIRLESGSGLALLKAVRTGLIPGVRADLCFIFVSACVDAAVVKAAAQLDVNGYLVKPFVYSSLRATVLRGREKAVTGDKVKYAAAGFQFH